MGCFQSKIKSTPIKNSLENNGALPNSIDNLSPHIEQENKSFSSLLKQIDDELRLDVYGQLLETAYLREILKQAEYTFITEEQQHSMLDLVLDYMAMCKNCNATETLKTKLNRSSFISKLGQRWLKLKNQIYFSNNDTLKILAILNKGDLNPTVPCFFNLKFDFGEEEMLRLAKTVKEFCRYDLRAFSFLSNYLFKSCIFLEDKEVGLHQIEERLVDALGLISKEHPPAPPLLNQQELCLKHQSFKKKLQEAERVYIDLSLFSGNEREQRIDQFIEERAVQANKFYNVFVDLIKDICTREGYHFKSGLKLNNLNERRALERIKEKMLKQEFERLKPSSSSSIKYDKKIFEFISAQQIAHKMSLQQMYSHLTGKIEFKVSDLLRAKCMFSSVDAINECCEELKKSITEKGFKIVEIDNRLRGKSGTSDIVLKILMGQTIAQLQLVIDLNVASYQFSHKLYQITRSKFYTPLTMLKIINEQLSTDYLEEVRKIIAINAHSQRNNKYQGQLTYHEIEKSFDQFIKILPVAMKESIVHKEDLLDDFFNRFSAISKASIESIPLPGKHFIHKNNSEYKIILKDYEQALKEANTFKQLMLAEYSFLKEEIPPHSDEEKEICNQFANGIRNIGRIYQNRGLNDKAIQNYKQAIKVILKADPNDSLFLASKLEFNIAWLEYKKCNFDEALQCYQKILAKQQNNIGKNNLEYASTLNNIGLVYYGQDKFPESLDAFEESLRIRELKVGKSSMECTSTLNNMGLVYNSMGKYPEALMHFQRCLQIKERIKGRQSTDCALTLNNIAMIFSNQGKLQQALINYSRSLEIRQAIKGPENIDCATTINNISILYYRQGEMDKALQYSNRSLSIRIRTNGQDSIDCASNYRIMGQIFFLQNRILEARQCFEKAEIITKKVKGTNNITYALVLMYFSMVDMQENNFQKAESGLEAAKQIILKIKGDQSINYSECCKYRGILLIRMGKLEQAEQEINRSLQIYKSTNGPKQIVTIELNFYLGQLQMCRKNHSAAKQFFQLAVQTSLKVKYCYQYYAEAKKGLADIYYIQNNFTEALRQYNEAIPILVKFNPKTYQEAIDKREECSKQLIQMNNQSVAVNK